MAWKKIPKEHHPLFYAAFPASPKAKSIVMFGGVAGTVGGHMFGGLWADSVCVRVGEKDFAKALNKGGEPFDPMGKGRFMRDMVLLPSAILHSPKELKKWLQLGFDFTSKLPPKKAKKKTTKKTATKNKTTKNTATKNKTTKKTTATTKAATTKKTAKKRPSKTAAKKKKTAAKKKAKTKSKTATGAKKRGKR